MNGAQTYIGLSTTSLLTLNLYYDFISYTLNSVCFDTSRVKYMQVRYNQYQTINLRVSQKNFYPHTFSQNPLKLFELANTCVHLHEKKHTIMPPKS